MTKPFRWPWGQSGDPVVGARALAAAGTLASIGWKPADGDYANALAAIVKDAGGGLINWRTPSSDDALATIPFNETALADAWSAAFTAGGYGTTAMPARIAIDTQSMETESGVLKDVLLDTYQKLLYPWLNRLDDNEPGQIGSLSFTTFDRTNQHDWQWPLRVGVPDPQAHALSDRLNATRGVRRDFMEIVPRSIGPADVVVLSTPEDDTISLLSQLEPGLAILSSGVNTAGNLIDHVADKVSTPTAIIGAPQRSMPRFVNEFADEIAHNKPLDVALFDAYRTIFNPKSDRSGRLGPLVLLAPRIDHGMAFEGIKLENRAKELADRLDHLPGRTVLGMPSRTGRYIGISRSARTAEDYYSGLTEAIEGGTLDFSREMRGGAALRIAAKAIDGLESRIAPAETTSAPAFSDSAPEAVPHAQANVAQPDPAGDVQPPTPEPFCAYPRLDAPAQAQAGAEFSIDIGFSDTPDPLADHQSKITITDARADEDMLVVVSVLNGQVADPNYARLPLDRTAKATFTIRAAADAESIRISASYLFRNNPVGSIVRTLQVVGRKPPEPDDPPVADLFRPMLQTGELKALDLVLLVKREEGTRITLQAIAGDRVSKQYPVDAEGAKQLANQLDRDQRAKKYTGSACHDAVQGVGQAIANLIPLDLQNDFLASCLTNAKAPPRVLILTDEPYIPWELALLDPDVTGLDDNQYFGALARIGRWWVAPRMAAPVASAEVTKISVVCADTYDLATNKEPLQAAIAERDWMTKTFPETLPVLGRFDPVQAWIKSLPIGRGHLAHFALHGYSNPDANEQVLILGDGKNLTPMDLSGTRHKGRDPRYGLVFLNACQVGTAALTLGQLAGFPGALLQAGTDAVIGPIWEINDAAAQKLVETFYEQTMKDRIPVSEALRQWRANSDPEATTTPLAYIFYGHPDLTLQRTNNVPAPIEATR